MIMLALARIRLDGGTQPRAETDSTTIEDYCHAMQAGAMFPPLVVFHDGQDHWLTSGFHRYHAAVAAGFEETDCDVRQGTRREAVLFSAGLNAEHGLRRTNDDKRRAVRKLLEDEEWRSWSDAEIARRARVVQSFVSTMRAEMYPEPSYHGDRIRTVQRGGQTYQMDTGGMARRPALFDAEHSRPVPVSAAPPPRPAGHREADRRPPYLAWHEALLGIQTAFQLLPLDPRAVVDTNPALTAERASQMAAWLNAFAGMKRSQMERAS